MTAAFKPNRGVTAGSPATGTPCSDPTHPEGDA
jgi:hypothetical protein